MLFDISAIDLARMQFAFTVSAHIIFPAFTIGLASYLAVLELLWYTRRDVIYLSVFNYWKTIFAVVFGMGVVSGITMSYQFGTNWSVFSDKAGPIIGPLMGYEVLSAFFLEAGFLGILLFGRKRVSPKVHLMAVLMVAAGTVFSAFWILSVNSWMQTPAGYAINDVGQFVPDDWLEVIFNPSFPYRLVHMVLAAYLTTALVVGATGAWHLLKDSGNRGARLMLSMAMLMLLFTAPLQIFAGDLHGLNTLEHQPAKVAAMEGHWDTQKGAPLILFGIPDDEAETTHFALEIPELGSLILTHDWEGEVPGLNDFAKEDRPPTAMVFFSFRIMVGLGLCMALLGLWGLWARLRGKLYTSRSLLWAAIAMGPTGFAAVLCGWVVTEVGRQPWTIQGLLRTADSAAPLDAPAVGASLLAFILVYGVVFGAGTIYTLRLMARPPAAEGRAEMTPGFTTFYPAWMTKRAGEDADKQEDPSHA
ncbi:MAG: cytochrome ubiquinol oxidase subunit I [Rhodospirillaceae bacterium]